MSNARLFLERRIFVRKKNDYFLATCTDYTYDGLGIVKEDGFPYFVKGMLLGEEGKIKVIKVLKNYGVGRLIGLTKTSDHRIEARCPVYRDCGGCHLQHMSLEEQQTFKTKYVKDCIERIAKEDPNLVEPCHMMDDGWFYRNKVQLPCGYQNGHLVTGFYRRHTNEIIANDKCFIQNERANKLSDRTRELLDELKISAYDKTTHKGCLRHILVKASHYNDDLMLVLITNGKSFRKKDYLIQKLTKEFPNLKTIIQNVNERYDNVILGDKEVIWYGDGYIEDYLEDVRFQISAKSFYQVNPVQAENLYRYALSYANLSGQENVIDAYCGIGTISLFLARQAKHVDGIEIVAEAIADANHNKALNNLDNVDFYVGDAKEFMQEKAAKKEIVDVVVCDPPRKGCAKEFLDAVAVLQPIRFVYVSCNVATLARDIAYLKDFNYQLEKIQPVDMFPQTNGVEAVALLTRKKDFTPIEKEDYIDKARIASI